MGGGQNAKAEFGYTQTGTAGRWMDVTLYTSRNPNLQQALQNVPEASGLAPTLKLETPEKPKPAPRVDDEGPIEMNSEPPKGKLVMYWGCSETVRPGQPKIVNLETATIAELGKFFESRHATQRGTHATAGRPIWPSKTDKRTFPAGASIVGQHGYSGDGVPESFKFSVSSAQDIMPEMKIRQSEQPKFVQLEWNAIPTARAYFLGSMGALPGGGDEAGMVIWTSSELPDSGFGLFDYQTNSAVDKWLGERVLLPPTTTKCAVPKEAAGQGMLRAIAYGTELNIPMLDDDAAHGLADGAGTVMQHCLSHRHLPVSVAHHLLRIARASPRVPISSNSAGVVVPPPLLDFFWPHPVSPTTVAPVELYW